MSNKTIEIGLKSTGNQEVTRALGGVVKMLEGLKKQGFDVSKVFKSLALDSGALKFNKDLSGLTKTMTGLTKETKSFLSVWTDQRVKASQDQQIAKVTKLNSVIERHARLLKDINLQVEKREKYERRLPGLLAQKSALDTQTLGGELQRLVPTTRMGGFTMGGAVAGSGIALIQRVAGMYADYAETQAQARAGNSAFMTPYIMEAYRGKSQRSAYMAQQGGFKAAGEYTDRQLRSRLLQSGKWGAAMGADSTVGSGIVGSLAKIGLGVGIAAGAVALAPVIIPSLAVAAGVGTAAAIGGGLTGAAFSIPDWSDPKATKSNVKRELFQQGIQNWLQEKGVKMGQFDYFAERADHYDAMQRLLGRDIWAGEGNETGVDGLIGRARRATYTGSEAEKAALDMVGRGGARAVKGDALNRMLRLQRYFGIDQAATHAGTLSFLGGSTGSAASAMESLTYRAGARGLGGGEMKIETESYVAGVMSAHERLMARYGVSSGVGRTSSAIAAGLEAAMPGNTLGDIKFAEGGFGAAVGTMAGAGNAFTNTMVLGRAMGLFGGGKMGSGLSGILASEALQNMPFPAMNKETSEYRAMAYSHSGLNAATATQEEKDRAIARFDKLTANYQREAGATAFTGVDMNKFNALASSYARLGPADAETKRDLLNQMGQLAGYAAGNNAAERGVGAFQAWSVQPQGKAVLDKILDQQMDIPAASTYVAPSGTAPGKYASKEDMLADRARLFSAPIDTSTAAVKAKIAEAGGEQQLLEDMRPQMTDITDAYEVASGAAGRFTQELSKMGGVGSLAGDLAGGIDLLTKALSGLNNQLGTMGIGYIPGDYSGQPDSVAVEK